MIVIQINDESQQPCCLNIEAFGILDLCSKLYMYVKYSAVSFFISFLFVYIISSFKPGVLMGHRQTE